MHRLRAGALIGFTALVAVASAATQSPDSQLSAYLDAAAESLPASAVATLARIPERERQLLALRAYLRAGESLEPRWSWSDEQIRQYEDSDEHLDVLAQLERISQRFAADNPGIRFM